MLAYQRNRFCIACLSLLAVLQGTAVVKPSTSIAAAAAPYVEKIEPPNWWIGLPDPMLMITGENLAGVRVSTSTPGVRVARTMDGLGGRYEFAWLDISKTAVPGKITFDLATNAGHQQIDLPAGSRATPQA